MKYHQLLCWFQIPMCSEVSWATLCSESPLWGCPVSIAFMTKIYKSSVSKSICMLGLWWTCRAESCFLISSSPPFWFPSPGILLSYQQTFSPQMSFMWTWNFWLVLLPHPFWNSNSIYSAHYSEKSLLFRWRWKSNIGAPFSLCHLRTLVLLRKLGLLFLDLKRFFVFICQRWHASCGVLSTLHFHVGFWL